MAFSFHGRCLILCISAIPPRTRNAGNPNMPLWLRIVWSLLVCFVLPINFKYYGPANLLWFSDIALLMITAALWLKSPLLASMAALSVLLLEIAWNVDFILRLITGIRG